MLHNKKLATSIFIISALGLLISFVLEPIFMNIGLCEENSSPEICFNLFYTGYLESIALYSGALLVTSILIFFTRHLPSQLWLIFTIVYTLFYMAIVFVTPSTSDFLQFQRDLTSLWLSILYFIISLAIIGYGYFKTRRNAGTS
jgi:prolipoprotein diacylglyceryltransferase